MSKSLVKDNDIFSIKINGALLQLRRSKVTDIKGFIPRYDEDMEYLDEVRYYIKNSLSRTLLIDGEVIALGGVIAIAPRVYNSWNIISKKYTKNRIALFKGLQIAFTQMQHYLYANKMIDCLCGVVSTDRVEAIRFNRLFGLEVDSRVTQLADKRYIVMTKRFIYE